MGQALVSFAGRDIGITLNGMIPDDIRGVTTIEKYLVEGRIDDLNINPNGIIIGAELARKLSLTKGRNVTIAAPNAKRLRAVVQRHGMKKRVSGIYALAHGVDEGARRVRKERRAGEDGLRSEVDAEALHDGVDAVERAHDGDLGPKPNTRAPRLFEADVPDAPAKLAADLRGDWNIDFDDAGAIGRRYRRQDEIGTPFCITVDFDSLEDRAVTVRDRDTGTQQRLSITEMVSFVKKEIQ